MHVTQPEPGGQWVHVDLVELLERPEEEVHGQRTVLVPEELPERRGPVVQPLPVEGGLLRDAHEQLHEPPGQELQAEAPPERVALSPLLRRPRPLRRRRDGRRELDPCPSLQESDSSCLRRPDNPHPLPVRPPG